MPANDKESLKHGGLFQLRGAEASADEKRGISREQA
jgi:hypothetical protein